MIWALLGASRARRREIDHGAWMERYNQVVAFKERNGHTRISIKEYPALNRWLNNQRTAHRSGTLHKERQALLDQIGIFCNLKPGAQTAAPVLPAHTYDSNSVQKDEEMWNKMFARLLEYSLQYGHTDIQADSEDQELMQWVSLQRILRKDGRLEEKREKDLCGIGVSWEPQDLDDSASNERHMSKKDEELWMSQFRLLSEFKKQHGHTIVPRTGETSALSQWMFVQQRLMERDRLPEDKKKQLANLLSTPSISPVAATVGSASSDTHAASRAEADAKLVPSPTIVDKLWEKAFIVAGGSSSVSATSSKQLKDPPRTDQKFVIGTRIEKIFEVDEESQKFGGNVTAFELFVDEDGTKAWGYLIDYDDGDREHMLEADVEKNLVVVKSVKRAAKSQGKPKTSKRMKQVNTSDAPSTEFHEKAIEPMFDQATITKKPEATVLPSQSSLKVSENSESEIQAESAGRDTPSSAKGEVKSRAPVETKKASREKRSSRVPRLRDAKLSRSSGEIATLPPVPENFATNNVATKNKKAPTKRRARNDSESDSSSSDEPLRSLVRKPDQRNADKEKEIQHELIDLLDDDDDDEGTPVADTTLTPTLQNQSHETSTRHQKFPKGTRISRTFFDLSDNEREKSYGGKVVDFVSVDEEKDWFYFIQYDDGDTEFMDEWEVAKFSSSRRS